MDYFSDQPDDWYGEDCANMYEPYNNAGWNDIDCGGSKYPFICMYPLSGVYIIYRIIPMLYLIDEPNDWGSGEDCANMYEPYNNAGWNDIPCSGSKYPFICMYQLSGR